MCEQLGQIRYVKAYQPGVDLRPIDREFEAPIITPRRRTVWHADKTADKTKHLSLTRRETDVLDVKSSAGLRVSYLNKTGVVGY